MATLKDVLDRQKEVTDKVSTQVRTLAFGSIVFTWGVISSADKTLASGMSQHFRPFLLLIAFFAVLSLVADYIQYFCAKRVVEKALSDPGYKESGDYKFDSSALTYRAQGWAFWSKQALCAVAVLIVLGVVLAELVLFP